MAKLGHDLRAVDGGVRGHDAGDTAEAAGRDAEPLVWSDVEREIERADRDRRERRHGWRDLLPPSQDQS